MTTYYTPVSAGSWTDAGTWANGGVPDSASDGVILNLSGGGSVQLFPNYPYQTQISVTVASLNILSGNGLSMDMASLSAAGTISIAAEGSLDMAGGPVTAASFINSGTVSGIGGISVSGAFQNYGAITIGSFDELIGADGLSITSKTFYNTGTITAAYFSWDYITPTAAGGFLNYSQGELSGGTYDVQSDGHLYLGTPGLVTRLAATVKLDSNDGDPSADTPLLATGDGHGNYVDLLDSLTSIAPTGKLDVVAGSVTLAAARLANSGQIIAEAGASLTLGPVTGSGTILDETGATVHLTGASSNGLSFSGGATLVLDAPKTFAGTISHFAQGDDIELSNISFSSVSGYHYASGALTLSLTGGTSVALHFAGSYSTAEFALSAGSSGGTEIQLVGVAAA